MLLRVRNSLAVLQSEPATRRLAHVAATLNSLRPSVAEFVAATGAGSSVQKSSAAAATAEPWTTPGHPGFDGRTGVKLFDLTGKVAFVTGSSMGLGYGMAVGLAQAGAHVVINSRKEEACKEVADKIEAMGLKAMVCAFDVTDEEAVVAGFKKVKKKLGSVDILVNNGALGLAACTLAIEADSFSSRGPPWHSNHLTAVSACFLSVAGSTRRSEFLESTTEDLDFVIDLNLRGPYICAREAGKIMKAQGGGKIINISSLMSVLGRATIQPYNATKFAINGLTRGLACELGPYNIQVSCGHLGLRASRPDVSHFHVILSNCL